MASSFVTSLAGITAAAALSLTTAALTAPTAAQANAVSVSCDASGITSFTPGVQLFPQSHQVTYRGDEAICNDHTGLGVQSARLTADFSGVTLSCLASAFGQGTGSGTIEWNIGGSRLQSRLDLNIDETFLNTAKVSGVIHEGPFEGRRFTGQIETSLLGGAGKCTFGLPFGGVKNANFTGHYSIG
ncbi:hypothetical protein [Nonomuraea sp. NPDC046570]|uniref:hypothetical protein n=1 Tax=Nonomuraea sp. NPDC046570 TaxID=3155255 RepID=UPI003411CD0E